MHKLLLVSDRDDVLKAFAAVQNWERIGFKAPHIRYDFEGAKQSLSIHHADAIAIALKEDEEKEKVIAYIRANFPYLPVFQAGTTPEETLRYLNELKTVLNRLQADFSSDKYDVGKVMLEFRHDLFRKLVSGEIKDQDMLYRHMRLLRSRMETDRPCILIELEQPAGDDDVLEGRWHGSNQLMERALVTSFARDVNGYHMVPLVTDAGRIYILAGPLHGQETNEEEESITSTIRDCTVEGIDHVKEYQGLDLRITQIQVFPSLNSLCE